MLIWKMEAPQLHNFSSKEFGSRIGSSLRQFQKEKFFCDVTISCEGRKVDAHKVVLARGSRLFNNILKLNPQPHPLIYLSDVKFSYLLNILDFMYQGEVSIDKMELNNFIAVARDLEINDLTEEAFKDSKQSIEDKHKKQRLGNSPKQELNLDYKIKTDNEIDEDLEQLADELDVNGLKDEVFKDSKESGSTGRSQKQQHNLNYKIKTDKLEVFPTVVNDLKINEVEDFENFVDEDFVYFDESEGIAIKNKLKESNSKQDLNMEHKIELKMESINLNKNEKTKNPGKEQSNNHVQRLQIRDITKLSANEKEDQSISFESGFSKTCVECEQCNKTFSSKRSLKIHVLSAHNGVRYPCSHCDYKATQRSDLKKHILSIHEGLRHPCSQCDFKAASFSSLRSHVSAIHEGIRFPCSECDYKATTRSDLKKHILSVHKGVRYPCSLCDRKFTTKGYLKEHILSIHEGIKYSCTKCEYKANTTQNLKRHVLFIHEGIRYPCSHCDYEGTQKINLKKHMNKYH